MPWRLNTLSALPEKLWFNTYSSSPTYSPKKINYLKEIFKIKGKLFTTFEHTYSLFKSYFLHSLKFSTYIWYNLIIFTPTRPFKPSTPPIHSSYNFTSSYYFTMALYIQSIVYWFWQMLQLLILSLTANS